jgi:D-alanyl-D-alanine carboxypeptidase
MMRAVFVLCVVTAACGPTMDERQPAGATRGASYLNALTRASKTPGIQYVVVNTTDVVFEYAGGWADIRRQVPVDAATTMMAYSMSKTITAVAALQLVEAGKVGLDDSVERYVDALPYGGSVTVRQLIAHTSGIPNPIPLRWVHPGDQSGEFAPISTATLPGEPSTRRSMPVPRGHRRTHS